MGRKLKEVGGATGLFAVELGRCKVRGLYIQSQVVRNST